MINKTTIPFLDLVSPHAELRDEIRVVVEKVLDTAGFIGGSMVFEFEKNFARFCDVEQCIGVANGTDALRFALTAAGVQRGDLVITVPNTFIATTEAISQVGARPVFIDVDERTYNLDVHKLSEFVENECVFDAGARRLVHQSSKQQVTAIVPVHLYGQPVDMDRVLEIAEKYGLIVVEDACQAHGAEYFSHRENRWRKVGSMGKAAAFSFYPGKNLGACGEAGAVTTNDKQVAQTVRLLRDHGQARKYYHELEGYNGRLDALQAGILDVKLKQLERWNEGRRQAARRYSQLFEAAGAAMHSPYVPSWAKCVFHLFVIRSERRDELIRYLSDENIGTGIHYPVPLHLQIAYEKLGYQAGDFPVAEKCAAEMVSLPMFPTLTPEQQERIVNAVMIFENDTRAAAQTSKVLAVGR